MQAPARIRRVVGAILVALALCITLGPSWGAPTLYAASAPKFYDRVLATSTTTGTGTYTLGSAITGFQSWAVVGNGNSAYYYAEEVDGNGVPSGGWEVGLGTYTSSGTTLSRDTILASSNSGSAVSWAAGTRRIGLTQPAAGLLPLEAVIAPTLLNSWVNLGSTYATAGYWKDAHGYVHLSGVVKDGTVGLGTPILTLPSGYRSFDAKDRIFLVPCTVSATEQFGSLYIASNGNVGINGPVGCNVYLSLEGITFRAGQ